MKQVITFSILFLMISFSCIAQESKKRDSHTTNKNDSTLSIFEFGLNTTSLIRNNLFDQKEIVDYPFDFMMNARIGPKAQFRFAFKIKNSKIENGENKLTKSNDLGFRIGLATNRNISEKLLVYFGFDLLAEFNNRETTSGSSSVTTSESDICSYGFGPIVGIGYQISKHFSVRVESELYYKFGTLESRFKSPNQPSSTKSESKLSEFNFNPPFNLLFFVSF